MAFYDVRVFNPFAPSNLKHQPEGCYRLFENEKKRKYEERVREVEHASFTPLIFSTSGGMGRQAEVFYKRLVSMIAKKRDEPYSRVMGWIRCRISFSLLRSSIMCIRGSRSTIHNVPNPTFPQALDQAMVEGQISQV